jgi:PhnB protein
MALTLDPYIFFQGNCTEAMQFYNGVFGGELTVQTYGQSPEEARMSMPEDQVMHAALTGGEARIFGSDTKNASAESKKVTLCLGGDDEAKMRKIFDGLSEGGKVSQALEKMFWGDLFGSVTDKFGVEWMMNVSMPKDRENQAQ